MYWKVDWKREERLYSRYIKYKIFLYKTEYLFGIVKPVKLVSGSGILIGIASHAIC